MDQQQSDLHESTSSAHNLLTLEVINSKPEELHGTRKIIHYADESMGYADHFKEVFRAVSGKAALGKNYNIIRGLPQLNKNGQFTGQVINAKAMVVFRHTIEEHEYGALKSAKYIRYFDRVALFTSFAADIAEKWPRVRAIANSQDPGMLKGLKYFTIAGSAAERALSGAIPAGVSTIYSALEKVCGVLPVGSSQCVKTLQLADSYVQTTFQAVTDTDNQGKAVWWVIDAVISPRITMSRLWEEGKQSVTDAYNGMFMP